MVYTFKSKFNTTIYIFLLTDAFKFWRKCPFQLHQPINYRYEKGHLGKGAYGYVYKCVDSKNKEVVAMKKVILDMENEGFPSTSIR
jgi:hypothetical protein